MLLTVLPPVAFLSQVSVLSNLPILSELPQDAQGEYEADPFLARMKDITRHLAFVESIVAPFTAALVAAPQPASGAA